MADRRSKTDPKKGFPGGFFLFIFLVLLVFWTIQYFSAEKTEKVAFSHQVEPLVNLNLIVPEKSKKIAQNDRLVTFSGKFHADVTQEGEERFRYLAFLEKNHELNREKKKLKEELDLQRKSVQEAAQWFLQVSGAEIPSEGFSVVGSLYDTPERQNSILIHSRTPSDIISLKTLISRYREIQKNPSKESIQGLSRQVSTLIQLFRSPKLGIGNETLKTELKGYEEDLSKVSQESNLNVQLKGYGDLLAKLEALSATLAQEQNHVRLLALRSTRNYVEAIEQYNLLEKSLEDNEPLLEKARSRVGEVIWYFNNQELSTRALEKQDPEIFSHWFSSEKQEWENFSTNKGLDFQAPDQPLNTVLEKTFKSYEPAPNYLSYLFTLLPVLVVVFLLYFVFSRQMKGGVGSSAMNFGKSPARLLTKEANKITFKDVAGVEEAKEELKEIVDFLKDPQKFTALGARIPKGVLLVGPPGTGKTLIAKAVAGEADRPFFSISGSDFVEMFVGVGASRIRDLFDQGKKSAPCIIFMDEIDAVGRHRGAGIGGGHDEREQTLNQLLVEMDGFDTKEGVILMAATNRPDILDKALLRPGRFDRRVVLDLPDIKGRYEILKVHARKIKIDPSVELMDIARNTPGASGADLENILNEAALLAARRGRSAVTSAETTEACDKVRFGKERRSLEMDETEKKTTAFHESGHAMIGLSVKYGDPVDKVTIIPRGFALGATHFMPKKNRLSYWKKEVLDQLTILMGGRAAEELFVHDMSSGAQQDIAQATKLARAMVCEWGMSKDLGLISYEEKIGGEPYIGLAGYHERSYSDETAKKIDKEIHDLIEEAHKRAQEIILTNKDKVQLMADMLMEFETLNKQDINDILEGKWDIEQKRARLKSAEELQMKGLPKKEVQQLG